jgi:hypothetical protein
LVLTKYGLLDPNPIPGEMILPRNYGRGPAIIMLNLRVSKVFAFGPRGEGSISTGGRRPQGGPFSIGSGSASTSTGRRYNLAVSASIRNILNHNNPGPIIGNIASPLFGQANNLMVSAVLAARDFRSQRITGVWSCKLVLPSNHSFGNIRKPAGIRLFMEFLQRPTAISP